METIKKSLLYIIKKQKEGVETTVTFDTPRILSARGLTNLFVR